MGGWKDLAVEDMRQVFSALKNIEAAEKGHRYNAPNAELMLEDAEAA